MAFESTLNAGQRDKLRKQIQEIDFTQIAQLYSGEEKGENWSELAARAKSPPAITLGGKNPFTADEARIRGEAALRGGELGVILVAGGQGTRLGFNHPKGMFPIGPLSNRTLFEVLIDRLRAVSQRYKASIPLYVMTSHATHEETVRFLEDNQRFGLPKENLHIFQQGVMPAVDAKTGKLLLSGPGELSLSPDGHGGMAAALKKSGLLQQAASSGLRRFFYAQIDNPLVRICDPELIGYHLLAESEMTTQVVEKKEPQERVGVVGEIDGQVRIIEYSDLTPEIAAQRESSGRLKLWAGNMAVHVIELELLQRAAEQGDSLPFHRAHKKVPYLNEAGAMVEPQQPNAFKFERFIFDLLPLAQNAIVVEGAKEEVFAPVKNAEGAADTPELAQAAMVALHRRWLVLAGASVSVAPVEINPLFALDEAELARKISPNLKVHEARYFSK